MSDDNKLAILRLLAENADLKKETASEHVLEENAHLRSEIVLIEALCRKQKERAERFLSESSATAEKLALAEAQFEMLIALGHEDRCPQGNGKYERVCTCAVGVAKDALAKIRGT